MSAARARFLAEGVDGASLRDIAADAKTSVGMVSYYFPSKDDLFLAVLEHVYPRLLGDVRQALEGDAPLQARIAAAYRRLHAMDDEEFAVVRILLREALVSSSRLQKIVRRFTAETGHVPMLLMALGQGVQEGAIREDLPPAATVVSAMALAMAPVVARRLATQLGFGEEVPSADEAAQVMAGVLFEGIGARSRPGGRSHKRRRQAKRSLR